ncbi:hypothetical protein PIB30_072022 [Stylosanthes scabra]|uniref:Uncharacterized protein n=1 Tax=Stylosanthes scabra TaxID=79078 RepID=A0ABU6XLS7_9FABA|nr:hypothetical protein [Stylosanthes scabra]
MITLLTYYYLIRFGTLAGGLPDFRKDFRASLHLRPPPPSPNHHPHHKARPSPPAITSTAATLFSFISVSSATTVHHRRPNHSHRATPEQYTTEPPTAAIPIIFATSKHRETEPLPSETLEPPYSAPFPSLFLAPPSSRMSAPGKPLLLYTFAASVTAGVTPVRRRCSVYYLPPLTPISHCRHP